jgi:hypothetical protein
VDKGEIPEAVESHDKQLGARGSCGQEVGRLSPALQSK